MTDIDELSAHLAEWHTKEARRHWLEAKWWADFAGEKVTVLDVTEEEEIPAWVNQRRNNDNSRTSGTS